MIEIPESRTISSQAGEILTGRKIIKVRNASKPHKFAFYHGDPLAYPGLLERRRIETVRGYGSFVELFMEEDVRLLIGDGTHMRYCPAEKEAPDNYQLLLELEGGDKVVFTVAMYGSVYALRGDPDNPYYKGSREKISPLDEKFDAVHFRNLLRREQKDISLKAFLATGQRIPGLGNGVLQDILFRAGLHPKRKIFSLGIEETETLSDSVKNTLAEMTASRGRDTEKDFYGNPGGYRTLLSKNTLQSPCPRCGNEIRKESYLGGAVYYCPHCQPL